MGSGRFVGVAIEWEILGMGFEEFVGVGQMGCGGFEEWVLGNFKDGVGEFIGVGQMGCWEAQIDVS